MGKSCSGCRVLRKACKANCSIRPCLQWIEGSRSQANATQFLAKFYGRSNFINLIQAAPHDQRPAIFRSLLYEASGRIVNPIYGSVGLLSSGKWRTCQMAVDAVLKGEDIHSYAQTSVPAATIAVTDTLPRSRAYDIRHIHRTNNEKMELDLTLGLDPIPHARSCTGNPSAGTTSEHYNFPPLAETSDGWICMV